MRQHLSALVYGCTWNLPLELSDISREFEGRLSLPTIQQY